MWKENWEECFYVRVKVIGRRVVFIYDEEFVRKNWLAAKQKLKLQEKIRKLKEGKFKGYVASIFKEKETAEFIEVPSDVDEFEQWIGEEMRNDQR
jgi:antirestriction protein ArdC